MLRRHRKSLEDEIARVEARLSELERERGQLSRKLTDLRQQLRSETGVQDRADWQAPASIAQYPAPTTPDEKIALFMDRFQGRSDVYPRLWINASKGRKGYSPACGNEWARGLCAKPKVKCGDCQHQAFLPVTKQVVRDHLQGRHVIGVYPMLADETCWFLAIDFDKAGWQNDVAAVAETCRNRAVPHAIERSRSGNGAHLWVFFNAPVPATIARKLGCSLLTETMARRHELPMTSYDRLFPNQDTLPKGGFGNLIALPFQHEPRKQGHSVFIDEQGSPYQDQWGFLASIPRLCPDEVDALVQEATERGHIIGVRQGGFGDDEEATAPWRRPPSHRAPRLDITEKLPPHIRAGSSQLLFSCSPRPSARLAEQLTGVAKHLIVLQGGMKTKERQAAVERLASISASEPRLVIAIGKFIGEGFDDTRLDTLFLAMPFSWKGTLVQYVGRLQGRHEAKTEVRVIDYVDRQVPMLARMLDKRMQGYRGMGYQL